MARQPRRGAREGREVLRVLRAEVGSTSPPRLDAGNRHGGHDRADPEAETVMTRTLTVLLLLSVLACAVPAVQRPVETCMILPVQPGPPDLRQASGDFQ